MTDAPLPLQVVVLDDDALARITIQQLLGRDLRTEVMAVFGDPALLVKWVESRGSQKMPHVFVIDPEYESDLDPAALLHFLRRKAKAGSVLFLSQYGDPEVLRAAIGASVDGFVLKREIGLAVATAVYLARTNGPVYSAALAPALRSISWDPAVRDWWDAGRSLPRWQLPPGLSMRQEEVVWYCLFYGMSARLTGEEIHLADSSVEKYRSHLYTKLEKLAPRWIDWKPLKPILHRLDRARPENYVESPHASLYTGDDWAFHLLTQLPYQG